MYLKDNENTVTITKQVIHHGQGLIRRKAFFRDQSRLPIKIELWELDPGVSEGEHAHFGENALEEIYFIQEGNGIVEIEGEKVAVVTGDCVLVPPGVHHGVTNSGETLLKILIIWGAPAI